MSLIELMVGVVVGLLVIAVAMGAVMVSRGVSSTVSDASTIQQQGAYLMRVIGAQLRQAGSLYLNPDPSNAGDPNSVLNQVAFEVKAEAAGTGNSFDVTDTVSGGTAELNTGFRRYRDNVFVAESATEDDVGTDYMARNCLGLPDNDSTDQRVESSFTLDGTELKCSGNGTTSAQAIARNVAEFKVTYLVQTLVPGVGTTIQYRQGSDMPAAGDTTWRQVQGVEVCLVLFGDDRIDVPAGSSYVNCDGESVDLTTLTGNRKNRMHLLFRNTFQLRSQGLI